MEAPSSISRSRCRAARHLARGLGLCGLTAALLALSGPAAEGGVVAGGAVVIGGPGGTSREFSEAEIANTSEPEGGTYTVRAQPGEPGERFTRTGVSVRRLLEMAELPPESIGYLTVPRADGSVAYLPAADFAEPPPFEDELPVLVSVDSGCVRFIRPLGIEAGDTNAEDSIASCGAPLAVGVRDGAILAVEAEASPPAATAGAPVHFTAMATGPLPGEEVSFRWSFGDGSTLEGAEVDHAFAAAGSYRVRVTATGSRESGGESVPLTVVVGSPVVRDGVGAGPEVTPKQPREPHGTGTTKGKGDAHHGGAKNGRGAKHAGDAANGGAAGGGKDKGEDASSGGRKAGGATETSRTVEPSPSPSLAPEPLPFGEPSPFSEAPLPLIPTAPGEAAASRSSQPGAPAKHRHAAAAAVPGQTVSGLLVADLFEPGSEEDGAGAPGAEAGGESFASAPPGAGGSVPVAALAVGALLAAGIGFEWRRRPYRGGR